MIIVKTVYQPMRYWKSWAQSLPKTVSNWPRVKSLLLLQGERETQLSTVNFNLSRLHNWILSLICLQYEKLSFVLFCRTLFKNCKHFLKSLFVKCWRLINFNVQWDNLYVLMGWLHLDGLGCGFASTSSWLSICNDGGETGDGCAGSNNGTKSPSNAD